MKNIYTLILFSATTLFAFGQRIDNQHDFASTVNHVSQAEIAQSNHEGELQLQIQRAGDDFFCEDFSNGLDGNNPYGAWSIEDTGDNTIWMMADASSPGGEFSTTIDPLNSPSTDNGWVIFDCDLFNTPISSGFEDVTGYLYSPVIDMTTLLAPVVDYYQYFRYCCFPFSPLTLEVSVDEGLNWTVFPGHGSFSPSANTVSSNPLYTKVDISCVASGQAAVQLRWGYNSAGNAGYSHYFWGLDDICIYDNPIEHDMEALQVVNGDVFNWWEYRYTPMQQAITEADGGLLVGTMFRNTGFGDQNNVTITVEILDDGMNVLNTTVENIGTVPAYVNSLTCPPQLTDTLYTATGWVPSATGMYYVRTTISSDEGDDVIEDNVQEKNIFYTDDEYGHDFPENFDVELRPRESDDETPGAPIYDPTGYANWFHIPNEGSTAYGLTATFGAQSDSGCEFGAILFQGSGDNIYDPNQAEAITFSYWTYDDAWDDQTVYFPFDDAVELFAGEVYFVAIMEEFGSDFEITTLATDNTDTDNSTLVYEISGAGDFVWFSSQNQTPGIRMITSERVGVTELGAMNGIRLGQNIPNPANQSTLINYTIEQPMAIQFELRDLSGRIIESVSKGQLSAGDHTIELNTATLAAGMYTYTLIANDDVRLTKKMMINK